MEYIHGAFPERKQIYLIPLEMRPELNCPICSGAAHFLSCEVPFHWEIIDQNISILKQSVSYRCVLMIASIVKACSLRIFSFSIRHKIDRCRVTYRSLLSYQSSAVLLTSEAYVTHASIMPIWRKKIDKNLLLESKVNFVYLNLTSIIPDYRAGVDSDELFRPAPGVNVILKHSVDAEKFTCNLLTCSYLYLDFNNFFYVSAFQQSQHTFVFLIHSFSLWKKDILFLLRV